MTPADALTVRTEREIGGSRPISLHARNVSAGETMAELAREYEVGEATIWRALNPFEAGAAW
jgi:hypothetical protein